MANCFKCSVTNTGSTLQYFDYQRCADYLTWYQVELFPGQVRRLWETSGSFRSPYDNPTIVFNCEPYPPAAKVTTTTTTIAPTSTPIPTATQIPTATPIPTATSVPTATPAPTSTSTPVPTATSTPIPTATSVPTATPAPTSTSTPVPTATSTPIPTATSVPTATPAPTSTSTPIPTATSTPIPTATSVPTATPAPTSTSTPTATASPTPSSTPTETPTPTPTTPPLNACYPLYFYNISGTLNYFDPATYTTSFFFDFESAISAMTRVDDNLLLYDGVDTLHFWDMTGYPPVETNQVNMSAFTQSGSDIYGLGPFTSTTEILVSDNTNGVYVADISTSPATRTLLFNNTLSNARCNILRDNNLGVTYLAGGTSNVRAFYDNGSQYSTTTITGTTRGLFRDELTAEIYAINDIGDVYYIPQLSGTVTSYYVSGITPDNIVLNGVAQSNNCTPNPYGFKLTSQSPSGVTGVTMILTANTFTWIDWGDGSPYTNFTGSTVKSHTYASPYVGDINFYTYDNFANFTGFEHRGNPTLVNGGTGQFLGTEFQKITGLKLYQSNPYATPFVLNASYTQIPNQIQTLLTFSTEVNLTGYTNELPSTLVKATLNGHGYGDVQYLPSTLLDLRVTYCSFSGNVGNINTPSLQFLSLYGDATISGDTSGLPSTLNYISLLDHNTISGNTSGLPKVQQSAYLTSGLYKPAIIIYGYNTISGDTSSFDPPIDRIDVGGNNTISGDTSGFANTATRITIYGNNTISGSLSGFTLTGSSIFIDIRGNNTISGDGTAKPSGLTYLIITNNTSTPQTGSTLSGNISTYSGASLTNLQIAGANTISGDTSDIPRNIGTLTLLGYNTISGDCADLPTVTAGSYTIFGNNTISGDIGNLPSTINSLNIGGNNTISGNVGGIPNGIVGVTISGNNAITGPLSALTSSTLTTFNIAGTATSITGPVTGINLTATGLKTFKMIPSSGGLTQSEVDDLLVYFTTRTWVISGGQIDLRGANAAPSAVGLAAKATLLAPPYNLGGVLTN